jgi:hypothetical protein
VCKFRGASRERVCHQRGCATREGVPPERVCHQRGCATRDGVQAAESERCVQAERVCKHK